MKTLGISACLGLALALGSVACGDDDDSKTKVKTPAVDVDVKKLSAAGSEAPSVDSEAAEPEN